jgi:threonine/homoserine efflux transporter RhtA
MAPILANKGPLMALSLRKAIIAKVIPYNVTLCSLSHDASKIFVTQLKPSLIEELPIPMWKHP